MMACQAMQEQHSIDHVKSRAFCGFVEVQYVIDAQSGD